MAFFFAIFWHFRGKIKRFKKIDSNQILRIGDLFSLVQDYSLEGGME